VTFAPGETTKQITIAISADTAKEGDESFSVALSNASGAALAAPRNETVTIQDRTVKKSKLKVRIFRLLSPVLRFAIASDADGTYRYKLTVSAAQGQEARPEAAHADQQRYPFAERRRQHSEPPARRKGQGQAAQSQDQADADDRSRRRLEPAPARRALTPWAWAQ
jgi:hypothetical protein